jgi:hypothetical protein
MKKFSDILNVAAVAWSDKIQRLAKAVFERQRFHIKLLKTDKLSKAKSAEPA